MMNKTGNNSKFQRFTIGLIIAGAFTLITGLSLVGWYNDSVKAETMIQTRAKDNENVYSTFTTGVMESAKVAEQYQAQFRTILKETMEGRYSADKPLLFLQEHNINIGSEVYAQLQRQIEAGRKAFERAQTELLDQQQSYRQHLNSLGGPTLAKLFGFPTVITGENAPSKDLDGDGKLTVLDYLTVVSAKTKAVFDSGIDAPVDPFAK
jgi:hypothetical protein